MGVRHIPANVGGLSNHRCPSSRSASAGFPIQFQTRLLPPAIYFPFCSASRCGPASPPIPGSVRLLCCDFKFKPHAAFTLRAVIVRISCCCCCALGGRPSHTFRSPTEVIKDTQPWFFKRAELPLCETQVCLRKAKSRPGLRLTLSLNVNLISSSVEGALIGSAFVCVCVCVCKVYQGCLCALVPFENLHLTPEHERTAEQ